MPGSRPRATPEPVPTSATDRTAVVFTAIEYEFQAVRKRLKNVREETHGGTVFDVGDFQGETASWKVAIAQTGECNSPAAAWTERAIAVFQPQVALFVGVAGEVKDVRLGDVVAGKKAYGYERGKGRVRIPTATRRGRERP